MKVDWQTPTKLESLRKSYQQIHSSPSSAPHHHRTRIQKILKMISMRSWNWIIKLVKIWRNGFVFDLSSPLEPRYGNQWKNSRIGYSQSNRFLHWKSSSIRTRLRSVWIWFWLAFDLSSSLPPFFFSVIDRFSLSLFICACRIRWRWWGRWWWRRRRRWWRGDWCQEEESSRSPYWKHSR